MTEERDHDASHPARPEQDDSFERGQETPGPIPEDEAEPFFARGQAHEPIGEEHHGRFSEGQEELGEEDPQKHKEGRFSEGQERGDQL